MFPEGKAFIGLCGRCDEPIIVSFVDGLKLKIDRISIPYKDALVLRKYWDIVLNIWSPVYRHPDKPVVFHATQWATLKPPERGRLYIRHLCQVKRKATKHGKR